MSTSDASTKTLSSQSPDAQDATNGTPVTGNDGPAPTEPEGGYPEQKHAGAVGYGPEYGRMHQATAVEKFEGLKEQLVGKVTHNPDKAEHGRELRTGELKRRQQQENDNTDPFKTAGGDKPGQAKTSGGSSGDVASNAAPTPVVDNGGPGATHPTEAGAREQAATTAPEGTREAGRQAQGGNTDKQKMLDESSTA